MEKTVKDLLILLNNIKGQKADYTALTRALENAGWFEIAFIVKRPDYGSQVKFFHLFERKYSDPIEVQVSVYTLLNDNSCFLQLGERCYQIITYGRKFIRFE